MRVPAIRVPNHRARDNRAGSSAHEYSLQSLRNLDVETMWGAANDGERRVLIEELIDSITVFPDHLEVTVGGAPPLNFLYSEVGLQGVGEPPCRRGVSYLAYTTTSLARVLAD